jgi:hypothetical protein
LHQRQQLLKFAYHGSYFPQRPAQPSGKPLGCSASLGNRLVIYISNVSLFVFGVDAQVWSSTALLHDFQVCHSANGKCPLSIPQIAVSDDTKSSMGGHFELLGIQSSSALVAIKFLIVKAHKLSAEVYLLSKP